MALIPITFKADDVDNEKKGSVQGQDLASFLAMGTSKSAGILDVLGSNACSIIGNPTISTGTATLTFNAGYIVIYGRLIYIEQGTRVQFELPTSSRVSGSLGIRVSLADAGAMECSWFTKTDELRKDNLLQNMSTGIYEFRLYDYTATPTGFSVKNKTGEKIVGLNEYFTGPNFVTMPISDKSQHLATTKFVNDLVNAGTELKTGDITRISDGTVVGKIYRAGPVVYGFIDDSITVKARQLEYDQFSFYQVDKSFANDGRVYSSSDYTRLSGPISDEEIENMSSSNYGTYIGQLDLYRRDGIIKGQAFNRLYQDHTFSFYVTFAYSFGGEREII